MNIFLPLETGPAIVKNPQQLLDTRLTGHSTQQNSHWSSSERWSLDTAELHAFATKLLILSRLPVAHNLPRSLVSYFSWWLQDLQEKEQLRLPLMAVSKPLNSPMISDGYGSLEAIKWKLGRGSEDLSDPAQRRPRNFPIFKTITSFIRKARIRQL